MEILTKSAAPVFQIKELTQKGEIEGYASTFGGEPDAYGDIIAPGAYSQSLADHKSKGTMPKMFWQHNSGEPIGRWIEASEDDKGLLVKGRFNMGVQRAREAYELIKAGDIDGLSIGYRIVAYTRNEDDDTLTLEKIDLKEVSIVSIGANESATISAVKSARRNAELTGKLAAGERLTEREFETLLKGSLGLSNSQAERAARIHLKGQGEPATDADASLEFLKAMTG